jgi:hypothetical protein
MLLGTVQSLIESARQHPLLYLSSGYGSLQGALRLCRTTLARATLASKAVFACLAEVVDQYYVFKAQCADSKSRSMISRRERQA